MGRFAPDRALGQALGPCLAGQHVQERDVFAMQPDGITRIDNRGTAQRRGHRRAIRLAPVGVRFGHLGRCRSCQQQRQQDRADHWTSSLP